ncbi:MAG TPA: GntR family transcriptional regulator [Symbiobacteriaceae bacterium]|jgi:GntR family transcriptional regulator|nr:GntR family transcriptional regulator [Symbiobacteriaceae bacterium]
MNGLGKDAPIPLYYQIKTRLLESIETGQLKPGDQVPSERELTTHFSVSRMTARQALTELENQGYLYRLQGKGTFVATPKLDQPLAGLTSFTEDMRRRGLEPGAQVLSAEEVPAGRKAARALGLSETAPVFRLERLRLAGGDPMALEIAHVPAALVPGLAQEGTLERSLYGLLRERYGIRLVRATQSLEAVAANEYEAQVLHVKEGTPLLLLERVSRDEQDRPVEFVRSLYRGDRYRFITELNRREEAP